jgi:hypothetical protein
LLGFRLDLKGGNEDAVIFFAKCRYFIQILVFRCQAFRSSVISSTYWYFLKHLRLGDTVNLKVWYAMDFGFVFSGSGSKSKKKKAVKKKDKI